MSEMFTARAQQRITFVWLFGVFALLAAEGLGWIKDLPTETLFSLTSVVLFFWFQRTRGQSPGGADGSNGSTKEKGDV